MKVLRVPGWLPHRLGARLNLGLVVFVVLLGCATAALVFWGFQRTQNDATAASREGLERSGADELIALDTTQSYMGGREFLAAADLAVQASRALAATVPPSIPGDALDARFTTIDGQLVDTRADRKTDLAVPETSFSDPETRSDIALSEVLDLFFPVQVVPRPGELANFDVIAIHFRSVTGVVRSYPIAGTPSTSASAFRSRDDPANMGPLRNPDRLTMWTRPYTVSTSQTRLITGRTPVYIGDNYRGYVAVDLSIDRLISQVDLLKPTPGGFAFYLDSGGELIRSAFSDTVASEMANPGNAAFRSTIEAMRQKNIGVDRVVFGGREVFVAYSPVQAVGGSLGVVAPVDELTVQAAAVDDAITNQMNRTLAVTITVMALMFALALGASAWFNRRLLLRPIGELVAGTRAVAAGNLDTVIAIRSQDEFGALAESFNQMTADVRQRNQAIAERESQYRSVFESTRDGLVISNLEGTVVEVNPAMCSMHGYTYSEFMALPRGGHVHPDSRDIREEMVKVTASGQPYRIRARNLRKDGSSLDVEVLGTPMIYRGQPHVLAVIRDISAQVEAEQLLETRVEERTRELSSILAVSREVTSTIELQPLIALVLDHLKEIVGYRAALVLDARDGQLVPIASRSPESGGFIEPRLNVHSRPAHEKVIERREPLVIADTWSDEPLAELYRSGWDGGHDDLRGSGAWMGVPLVVRDRVLGMIALEHGEVGHYTPRRAELAFAFANQAAVAIENARLFAREEERAHELSTLLELGRSVTSTLELNPLLETVLEHLEQVVPYSGAGIIVQRPEGYMEVLLSRSSVGGRANVGGSGIRLPSEGGIWDALSHGQPVVIADIMNRNDPFAVMYHEAIEGTGNAFITNVRAWLGVPLAVKGESFGLMALSRSEPGSFGLHDVEVAVAFANHASVAIENARLFAREGDRSRELATMLDLARSVTSTLELSPLLALILERLETVLEYAGAGITVLRDDGDLEILLSRNTVGNTASTQQHGARLPARGEVWNSLVRGEPVIIHDVLAEDDQVAADFRQFTLYRHDAAMSHVRSWMGIPLAVKGATFGLMAVSRTQPGALDQHDVEVAMAFASHAAVAIENARLFAREGERSRELATLLDVAQAVTSTLDLDQLLRIILEELRGVVGYDRAFISTVEGDRIVVLASSASSDAATAAESARANYGFQREGPITQAIMRGETVIIDDVLADDEMAAGYRESAGERLQTEADDTRAWMAVPLVTKGDVFGILSLSRGKPGAFTRRHARLATTFANGAAVAIENARLFAIQEQRAHEMETLVESARNVASTLDLDQILEVFFDQLAGVIDYLGATVAVRDGDSAIILATRLATAPERPWAIPGRRFSAGLLDAWPDVHDARAFVIADVRDDSELSRLYRETVGPAISTTFRDVHTWMAVPLVRQQEVFGILSLSKGEGQSFSETEVRVAEAMAGQAAIAIENARLFAREGDRARELQALVELSNRLNSTLDLNSLFKLIFEQLGTFVKFAGSSVIVRDGDHLTILASHSGANPLWVDSTAGMVFPMSVAGPLWDDLALGKPVIIDDVRGPSRMARLYREAVGHLLDSYFKHVHVWLAVPLIRNEEVFGFVSISKGEGEEFSESELRLAGAIASQVSVAFENARLFDLTQQRARETSALAQVASNLSFDRPMGETLNALATSVVDATEAVTALVVLIDSHTGKLSIAGVHGYPAEFVRVVDSIWGQESPSDMIRTMERGQHLVIPGQREMVRTNDMYLALRPLMEAEMWDTSADTLVIHPMIHHDRVIGALFTYYRPNEEPGPSELSLLEAIANQAAIAAENARLFFESERRARERTALARIASFLTFEQPMEETLSVLAREVVNSTGAISSSISIFDGTVHLGTGRHNLPAGFNEAIAESVAHGAMSPALRAIVSQQQQVIDHARQRILEAADYASIHGYAKEAEWDHIVVTPMVYRGRVLGTIEAYYTPDDLPDAVEMAFLRPLADQIGVALENILLFNETGERVRQLESITYIASQFNFDQPLEQMMTIVAEKVVSATAAMQCSVSLGEGNPLRLTRVVGQFGADPSETDSIEATWARYPVYPFGRNGEPARTLVVPEGPAMFLSDPRYAEVRDVFEKVRWDTLVIAPMTYRGNPQGVLTLGFPKGVQPTPQEIGFAEAIADQAALAIANSRLFRETDRRMRETEALYHADEELFASLSLDRVLGALVTVAVDVLGADMSSVQLWEVDSVGPVRAQRGASEEVLSVLNDPRFMRRETFFQPEPHDYHPEARELVRSGVVSGLELPILAGTRFLGSFRVGFFTRHESNPDEERTFLALAERAGVAIQNAELYARAQDVASLEERQRLARELHDSVSQALYGIALGARTARTQLERDPARAAEPLEYVLSLAEAGLAEMRALIFELRPESLATEGIIGALQRQVVATRARYGVAVDFTHGEEPDLPVKTKESLYRVAQEALHNTVKHARATHVDLRIADIDGSLMIEVTDDGIGFDPGGDFPGHLGLQSMRERMQLLGGSLEVVSRLGEGSTIRAIVPRKTPED